MDKKALLKEKLATRMKEAGMLSWAKKMLAKSPTTKKVLENAAVFGGAGLLLSGGAAAASALANAVKDPIKKRVGKNRMMRENSWLQHEDKGTVNKYYNTLYRFAPNMAMDPLVAGSFMKKQLEYKDIGIQPSDVNTLVNIQKSVRDQRGDGLLASAFKPSGISEIRGLGRDVGAPEGPRYDAFGERYL